MKHKFLNYEDAHKYVDNTPNTFWDSWDIVIFKPEAIGFKRSNGLFHDGRWGTTRRIKVSDQGTWRVPVRT